MLHLSTLVPSLWSKLAIIGWQVYSDAQTWRKNCVNIRRYRKTVAEVCGAWCAKNDARSLFPVCARSDKMAVRNTSIFGKVYLFSDTVVCAFSEGAFGEILASIRCHKTSLIRNYFRSGSCLEHSGAQLNTSQSDSINNRTVNLSFLAVLSSNKLKSPQFSKIHRLLATCWYLSGVCALSSSRDIAQYRSNSPVYTAHKSTSVLYGKQHVIE